MKWTIGLWLALAGLTPADAQDTPIFTGGDKGAYHSLFCPPLPDALANEYFYGYRCTPSAGTRENIRRVLADPTAIGFAQLDVFAREAATRPDLKRLVVARELACEGLWMVTKNPRIESFGTVTGLARRIPFVLPPEDSGSVATFRFIQSLDPDGLGQAQNVRYAESTTDMLNQVAASDRGEVGFFVQFADPENGNIKLIVDKELTVLPVIARPVIDAKIGDRNLYQIQTFALESGFFKGWNVDTACTPAVIITGDPGALTEPGAVDDQKALIGALTAIPADDLLPKESRIAAIIKGAKWVTGVALDEALAAYDLAKEAAREALN